MRTSIKEDYKRKPDLSGLVYGKVPPQAPEVESAVLGVLLLEKDALGEVMGILNCPECFYVDANQKIYAAIIRLNSLGSAVDLLTVTEELRKSNELEIIGGAYYLTGLTMSVVTGANIQEHATIIFQKYTAREIIRISGRLIADAYDDSTDIFDLRDKGCIDLFAITDGISGSEVKHISKVIKDVQDQQEDQRIRKLLFSGVTTGFNGLNNHTNGWQGGHLIIIAARPGIGKTAFTLNLATNAALESDEHFPVAFFSLEMGAGELIKRMQADVGSIELDRCINASKMTQDEWDRSIDAGSKLSKAPIYIDDTAGITLSQLKSKATKLVAKKKVRMIIIDYLQLMKGDERRGGNREQEISQISRNLKGMAKELNVPVIALSQLNRAVENRAEKIPNLSDLRESGAIEQDADMIFFLYHSQDLMDNVGDVEVILDNQKNRHGPTDKFKILFEKRFQRFQPIRSASDFGVQDNPRAGMPAYRDFTEPIKNDDTPF